MQFISLLITSSPLLYLPRTPGSYVHGSFLDHPILLAASTISKNNNGIKIKDVTSSNELTAVRTLFTSYVSNLGLDLSFQDFHAELADLPGCYAKNEQGALLVAVRRGEVVGCVWLRRLKGNEEQVCEMKRLYCIESVRGEGVGRMLVEEIVKRATELGYEEMRLDTLPSMEGARKLYARHRFVERDAYYETPLEGTIFMSRDLSK